MGERVPQYTLEQVRAEADRMAAKVEAGQAKDYSEAAKLLEQESKFEEEKKRIKINLDIQKEKDEFRFRRGEFTEGHPTLAYVRSLSQRIPLKEGFPLIINIVPDWREQNAAAFPDGNVFISSRLIKAAETEEALLGVISHEYVHAYKEHSKKQAAKKTKSLSTFLERLSLLRGHEYEADLRGVLVDLEQAGISPLGYKAFLEKSLMRSNSNFTHGSGIDRVLNISTAIHLFDFKSLTQDLHEIPKELLEALDTNHNVVSHNDLFRPISGSSKEEILEIKKSRDYVVESIPDIKDAMTAIRILSEYTFRGTDGEEAIDKIYEKLDNLLPKELDAEAREMLKLLALEFFTELSVFDSLPARIGSRSIYRKIN